MNKRQKFNEGTIKNVKTLALGKVGKSMQGECIKNGKKRILMNHDKTIKAVWED